MKLDLIEIFPIIVSTKLLASKHLIKSRNNTTYIYRNNSLSSNPTLHEFLKQEPLRIAINGRLMLRKNIDINMGLINGAIGILTRIEYSHCCSNQDHENHSRPVELKIKFSFLAEEFILPLHTIIYENPTDSYLTAIKYFPVCAAFAITIHKSQGITVDNAIIGLDKVFVPSQTYVACSRVRSLSGLFLISLPPVKSFSCNKDALIEQNRLRNSIGLPCYNIPDTYTLHEEELSFAQSEINSNNSNKFLNNKKLRSPNNGTFVIKKMSKTFNIVN